jgi:hypothetical protein
MKWFFSLAMLVSLTANIARAQFANQVISYDPGSTPAFGAYTTPSTALGSPTRDTVEFIPNPNEVTIFNPPFGTHEIVSVGEGGHVTLKLSNYVLPGAGAEIGVFSNVSLIDIAWPNGQVGTPAATFGDASAEVEVSADGVGWVSLGVVNFNLPTQGYSDAAGTVPSNFLQPFAGVLSDFDGLPYNHATDPDVFDLLAGSGGGNWLDISSTGLTQAGYIRFSVADDLDPLTSLNIELDAVSISAAAMGGIVPEPTTFALLGAMLIYGGLSRRRNEER